MFFYTECYMKIYLEKYRLFMKYILCNSGKGYYCCHVGPLEEFICICASPNNKPSQTFIQGKSSPILRNSVPSLCVVFILILNLFPRFRFLRVNRNYTLYTVCWFLISQLWKSVQAILLLLNNTNSSNDSKWRRVPK